MQQSGQRHSGVAMWRWWLPNWSKRLRKPADADEWIITVIVVLAAWATLGRLVAELLKVWYLIPLLVMLAVWGGRRYLNHRWAYVHDRRRRLAVFRLTIEQIDALDMRGDGLEHAVCELLCRDGFAAVKTGGTNDRGRDVYARDPYQSLMWVFQCKHNYQGSENLGPGPIRELNGTAWDFHNADQAIAVTNKGFTRAARTDAHDVGIHLIDRDRLIRWATQGETLHEALGLKPGRVSARRT